MLDIRVKQENVHGNARFVRKRTRNVTNGNSCLPPQNKKARIFGPGFLLVRRGSALAVVAGCSIRHGIEDVVGGLELAAVAGAK